MPSWRAMVLSVRDAPSRTGQPRASTGASVPTREHGAMPSATSPAPAIRTVGVPKEIKTKEYRVAMTPDGVREFERRGIAVSVETGAGSGASFSDEDYVAAGARIVATAAEAWAQDMVVKVKEPKAEEFAFLREDLTLF